MPTTTTIDPYKDAYWLQITTNAYEPRFEKDSYVMCLPHQPIRPGYEVVICTKQGGWSIKAYNPAKVGNDVESIDCIGMRGLSRRYFECDNRRYNDNSNQRTSA